MFTGIIQQLGRLQSRARHDEDETLVVTTSIGATEACRIGDSIAVNGVCLTATAVHSDAISFDVSAETLHRTTLGQIENGESVNLESALRVGDALGGHLVSGHVDAIAEVLECRADGRSQRIWISLPQNLAHLVAIKGSICVDGTSLTVNDVELNRFSVNIVPHTLEATIIGDYQQGTRVNLEADMFARYVARILEQTQ